MANILLVDDDTSMRSMVARALTSDGHHVTEASDGDAALDNLARTPGFSLLLTDVQMPGMDGLTLAARACAAAPALRVVVISALEQEAVRTGQLGPKARWLAKPFTLDQIRAEVRAALA
jgi:DNA-binding response OmpR family regulator